MKQLTWQKRRILVDRFSNDPFFRAESDFKNLSKVIFYTRFAFHFLSKTVIGSPHLISGLDEKFKVQCSGFSCPMTYHRDMT